MKLLKLPFMIIGFVVIEQELYIGWRPLQKAPEDT